MDTVDELCARNRRSDRIALEDASGRTYDYHWFCTHAWKAGNFLRHVGIRTGVTVNVVGTGPLALLAFFGTALLEGTTRFVEPGDIEQTTDVRAIIAPVEELPPDEALQPGTQRVGYGGNPDSPDVHHFDSGLWSENPSFPPIEIEPDLALLADRYRTYSHRTAMESAATVVDRWTLDEESRVGNECDSYDPETVIAGVLAPLVAGGTVVLSLTGSSTPNVDHVVSGPEDVDCSLDGSEN